MPSSPALPRGRRSRNELNSCYCLLIKTQKRFSPGPHCTFCFCADDGRDEGDPKAALKDAFVRWLPLALVALGIRGLIFVDAAFKYLSSL